MLPNHFHLLLRINDFESIPSNYQKRIHQPFSNLFNAYSKAINKKYNRTGSLIQEHLHRIKVNSEEYFKQLLLYIHLNPEKHEICENFSDYKHSSYNSFIINKPSLLNRKEVFDYFIVKITLSSATWIKKSIWSY